MPPPGMPPGISFFSGMSVMHTSVVRMSAATLAAFWSAERATFVGSTMPA
jgi:hypothetical protein